MGGGGRVKKKKGTEENERKEKKREEKGKACISESAHPYRIERMKKKNAHMHTDRRTHTHT